MAPALVHRPPPLTRDARIDDLIRRAACPGLQCPPLLLAPAEAAALIEAEALLARGVDPIDALVRVRTVCHRVDLYHHVVDAPPADSSTLFVASRDITRLSSRLRFGIPVRPVVPRSDTRPDTRPGPGPARR